MSWFGDNPQKRMCRSEHFELRGGNQEERVYTKFCTIKIQEPYMCAYLYMIL